MRLARKRLSIRKDRAIFRKTAIDTKKINTKPISYRGGTRL